MSWVVAPPTPKSPLRQFPHLSRPGDYDKIIRTRHPNMPPRVISCLSISGAEKCGAVSRTILRGRQQTILRELTIAERA